MLKNLFLSECQSRVTNGTMLFPLFYHFLPLFVPTFSHHNLCSKYLKSRFFPSTGIARRVFFTTSIFQLKWYSYGTQCVDRHLCCQQTTYRQLKDNLQRPFRTLSTSDPVIIDNLYRQVNGGNQWGDLLYHSRQVKPDYSDMIHTLSSTN